MFFEIDFYKFRFNSMIICILIISDASSECKFKYHISDKKQTIKTACMVKKTCTVWLSAMASWVLNLIYKQSNFLVKIPQITKFQIRRFPEKPINPAFFKVPGSLNNFLPQNTQICDKIGSDLFWHYRIFPLCRLVIRLRMEKMSVLSVRKSEFSFFVMVMEVA